jgi:triacylglycerol lipase
MTISQLAFTDLLEWALATQAAYDDDATIRQAYGSASWTSTLPDGVKVFVARAGDARFQWLSVRGTDDRANVCEDAEYLKDPDPRLGVYFHSGFFRDAQAVYAAARPQLVPELPVRVTGHSLGGAIAAIVQAWLRLDGFVVETTVTFGQPKVTNEAGVLKLRATPLLRVVNDEDVVPMVPPLTLLAALHGPYRHFGQELHLGPAPPVYRLYTEHDAELPSVSSFWDDLFRETPRDHHVALYVAKVKAFRDATPALRPAATIPPQPGPRAPAPLPSGQAPRSAQ